MKRRRQTDTADIQITHTSPPLNQDVMNEIAKYVSYKMGLSAFRQTSKHNNALVENTRAGQLARTASDLEPSWIRTSLDSLCNYANIHFINAITGAIVSTAAMPDFSMSVISISEMVAACVAGFSAGSCIGHNFLPVEWHYVEQKWARRIGEMSYSQLFGTSILIAGISSYIGISAGGAAGIISGFIGLPSGVDTSISPPLYLSFQDWSIKYLQPVTPFEIALNAVCWGYIKTSLETASISGPAAAIANMGIFSNKRKLEAAHAEMISIREPLAAPCEHIDIHKFVSNRK